MPAGPAPCRRHRGRRGTARSAPVRAGRRPGSPAGGRHRRREPVAGGRWRRAHGRAGRTPLGGHHRVIALALQRVDGAHQEVARIGDAGGQALARVHADLHRRRRDLPPGQAHQAAGQGVGAAVDVADVPDQAGVLDILAVHCQPQDGARQRPAAAVDGQQFVAVQQFAAWHAIGVEDEQFEEFDIGIGGQEILGFLFAGEVHGALLSVLSGSVATLAAALRRRQRRGTACKRQAGPAVARGRRDIRRDERPADARGGNARAPRRPVREGGRAAPVPASGCACGVDARAFRPGWRKAGRAGCASSVGA